MKKRCVPALFAALAFPAIFAFAAQPPVPPDGLKLDKNPKQVVIFNHGSHKDIKCGECHHMVEGKENYGKCFDAGCHDVMDRKDKSAKSYYNVAHAKSGTKFSTCVSCHMQVVEKTPDKKKELTACKQSKCHP
jgi:hypothetical protein